jgi:hypothetical protein
MSTTAYFKKKSLNSSANKSSDLVSNEENLKNRVDINKENLSKDVENETNKNTSILLTGAGVDKQNNRENVNYKVELYSEIKKKLKNQTQDYLIRKHNSSSNNNNIITNTNNSNNKSSDIKQQTQTNTLADQIAPKTINTELNEKSSNSTLEKAFTLYNQHKNNIQKRLDLYQNGKLLKEEKELKECTFIPDTSMFKTQKLETGEVYERNQIWKNKKQTWIDQEKNNLTLKKDTDCTFKPSINNLKITYPEMNEKQLNFTNKYKDRIIEAEKRKQENKIRLLPNYEKLYEQTHNYNKNIEPYLEKIGMNSNSNSDKYKSSEIQSKLNEGKKSNNQNLSFFNNLDMNLVILALRNEIKNSNLDIIF